MTNIIVYRSSFERDADLFWSQNPELLIGLFIFAIVAGLIMFSWPNRRK